MNNMICDDRMDINELMEKIYSMTDEEFTEYLKSVENKK